MKYLKMSCGMSMCTGIEAKRPSKGKNGSNKKQQQTTKKSNDRENK